MSNENKQSWWGRVWLFWGASILILIVFGISVLQPNKINFDSDVKQSASKPAVSEPQGHYAAVAKDAHATAIFAMQFLPERHIIVSMSMKKDNNTVTFEGRGRYDWDGTMITFKDVEGDAIVLPPYGMPIIFASDKVLKVAINAGTVATLLKMDTEPLH
jgi:hypothetical protein